MKVLEETGMLGNSVVLFMSDNGGPTKDPDWLFENAASNWPLRGVGILCSGNTMLTSLTMQ